VSLVDRFVGAKRKPRMPAGDYLGSEALQGAMPVPEGIVIDGAVYALDGQPPVARTDGWGSLSWLWQRRR
jgi:hypothetical protein